MVVISVIKIFLYNSVYFCHVLIPSASVSSIPYMSFIVPIFAWNIPLVSLNFLKEISSFPFCCFPLFLCTVHWGRLSCLLAVLWNSAFRWLYLSSSFTSLLYSAICKASSDNHFAFLHFFFLGMDLITTSYTVLLTSIHSSSGTLSTRSNLLNLFVTSTV